MPNHLVFLRPPLPALLQLYQASNLNTNQHGRQVRCATSGRTRSNAKAPPRRTYRTANPPSGCRSKASPKSARHRIRPSRNPPRPTAHPPTPPDPSRCNLTHTHARGPRSAGLRLGHRNNSSARTRARTHTCTPANTTHPERPRAPAAGLQAALWPAAAAASPGPHARAHAIHTALQPPNIERLSRAFNAPHPAPARPVSECEASCEPYRPGNHPVRRAAPRA